MSGRQNHTAYSIAILALCAAIMFVQQVALAVLPNIELVSILVIIFTLTFKKKVLYIIYIFVFLEGLFYGFNPWWWIAYLYVWTFLALVAWLFRSCNSPIIWAVVSGIFGLIFDALCAIPHLVIGGPAMAFAYWVGGIPFSIIHGIGNFIIALLLWKPLMRIMSMLPARKAAL